jgi:hypothetical protein
MQTPPISDPEPATPRRARPAEARSIDAVPTRLLALAATFAAWSWITRQPPQISADILQALLLMAMGALGAKLVSELVADLRGKEGLEILETFGKWIATVLASAVSLLLMGGVLTVLWYFAGPTILRFLSLFGLNS